MGNIVLRIIEIVGREGFRKPHTKF